MKAIAEAYPTQQEVEEWCAGILQRAEDADLKAMLLEKEEVWPFNIGVRHTEGTYVSMRSRALGDFYCFWQPCPSGRGPLLVHTPGFSAEVSAHPELVADGYNVLHVNPLGYATPRGRNDDKMRDGTWPVWEDTVTSLGKEGYVNWLSQAAAATLWALQREEVEADRFAFFGTSQGGRGSIALGSMFRDRGTRAVAADVPGLTNWQMTMARLLDGFDGSLEEIVREAVKRRPNQAQAKALLKVADRNPDELAAAVKAIGFIDTVSHAPRMTMPVLLTAGSADTTCPAEGIFSMFQMLPGTRSYTELAGQKHAYTMPFVHLVRAWFRLYV